jgi:hypothetical protein
MLALYGSMLPEGVDLIEIVAECREEHLDLHPFHGSDEDMSGLEDAFDHGIVPFTRRSLLIDPSVP